MARPNLAQLRDTLEFQHVYHWNIEITRPPNAGFLVFDADRWNMQAFSIEIPRRTTENAQVDLRGHRIHEPGRVVPAGELTLTYVETTDAFVRQFVKSWTEAVRDRVAPVVDLLGDITIISNNGIGGPDLEAENYSYQLQRGYLRDSTPPTLEGGSPDPAQWSLTIQYNDFIEGTTL